MVTTMVMARQATELTMYAVSRTAKAIPATLAATQKTTALVVPTFLALEPQQLLLILGKRRTQRRWQS